MKLRAALSAVVRAARELSAGPREYIAAEVRFWTGRSVGGERGRKTPAQPSGISGRLEPGAGPTRALTPDDNDDR